MKPIICLLLLLFITAGSVMGAEKSSALIYNTGKEHSLTQKEADVLVSRLQEIRKESKGELSAERKKELRSEVLVIREKLTMPGDGIYISVGALLVIIILLIILL